MSEKRFEDAMQRLEDIVEDLEGGEMSLEKSMKAFEEGMKLVGFCTKKLEEAEQKVTMLVKESEGQYIQRSFEGEDKDGI